MGILTPAEYRALLRQDLYSFIHRSFYELYPETKFLPNWHIEVIAAKLEACWQGKIRRLVICLPPRHLKSFCVSVAFPAYVLGHDPAAQFICASYGQDLADKHSRDFRNLMWAPFYQAQSPTRLSAQRQSVQEYVTTKQGFRLATSVGGVLTGRGGDFIIIDDPLKPDEAVSESRRRYANEWYDGTLASRLNDKEKGCIILVMQRLHEDDLVGHVLKQQGWEVVSFPAIAEREESYEIETVLGISRFKRAVGDILHHARESRETLEQIKQTLGEYNFAGQYQQSPAPLGGGMIKEDWFKYYGPNELPETFDQIVQSWDTANKPGELNDFSVCTTWGIKDNRYYLLHVLRKRMGYPDLKRAVRDQAIAHKATVILIEDKASGTQLIQDLIEDGITAVTRFKPEGDKIMRLHAQTGAFENGFVYLPRDAHWLADYRHELVTFPNGKFDDQVDSTSQALGWAKQRFPGWGIFEYMRREAEAARGGISANMVRLKMPAGISSVCTFTGKQVTAEADGTVVVSEEDARWLLAAGFTRA